MRRCISVFAVVAVLVVPALPAAADPPPTADAIYRTLGVNDLAADYVVLVDTSSSMQQQHRYDRVKASLRALFAALAPTDQVTLVTFAGGTRQVWQGPVGDSPDVPIAALPPVADGRNTDIGRALAFSVQALTRPSAPEIATVILLTDGKHEPAFGSPYPLESGYSWNRLHNTAAAIHKTSLHAYAIPLAGSTSAGLLKKVYGDAAAVLDTTSVDDLTLRLEEPKAAAKAAKALSILAPDLAQRPQVTWSATPAGAGSSTAIAVIQSRTARLPITAEGIRATACPGVTAHVDTDSVTLEPGQSATLTVGLTWDKGPVSWRPFATQSRQCSIALAGTVRSSWSAFLSDTLHTQLTADLSSAAPATLTEDRGSWRIWLTLLLGLLALTAVASLVRWRRAHPVLSGLLIAEEADGPRRIRLGGRRMTISAATAGIRGAGTLRGVRRDGSSGPVLLEIAYSRDGSATGRAVATCEASETATVSGIRFEWRPEDR